MSLLGNLTVGILGNMNGLNSTFNQAQNQVQKFGKNMQKVGSDITTIGSSLTKLVTVPIVALGGASLKLAMDFETAFTNVRKYMSGTEADFAKMSASIRQLAKETPFTTTEISNVAAAAAQLGIKKENIIAFSKTMLDLGVSTNLTAEEAASVLAKFANITQMPQKDFERLGSTITALGNNFAAMETDIVALGQRLAGAGHQVGMTEAQIMGISAALTAVGVEAEAGGTAFSKLMIKMASEVATNGKHLKGFAEVAGMTADQFKKSFKEDAAGTIVSFVEGLGKMKAEGKNTFGVIDSLGLSEVRLRDALLRASGAGDLLRESLDVGTKAWKENTELAKTSGEFYATTANKFKTLMNRFKDIGITIGGPLIDAFLHLMDAADPLIKMIEDVANWFSKLNPSIQAATIVIAGIAAAIGPALVILGTLISSVGSLMTAFAGLSGSIAAAGGVMGILTGPIGLTIAAIVALGATFIALWKNSETFRNGFNKVIDGIKAGFQVLKGVFALFTADTFGGKMKGIDILSKVLPTDKVVQIVQTVNKIKSVIKEGFSVVVDFVNQIGKDIGKFWDENGAIILQAVGNVFNGIMAVVNFVMPAIKFIIEMVWTAIKQVISGALNVIMGLIKVFSGLFTGDFGKMWEGIKQIFFGAIDLIIGWMTLTFVGGIRSLLTNLAKLGINLVKGMGDGIVGLFKTFTTSGSNLAKGMVNGVLNFFKNLYASANIIFNSIRSMGATVWTAIKETIVTIAKIIWDLVRNHFTSMLNSIKNIFGTVKSIISSIWNGVMQFFKSINLYSIGKDIIKGLINGIGSMASSVWEKVKSITDSIPKTIKKLLGIHSPSRVTTTLGEHTGQGLANGISKKAKAVAAAAKKVASEAIKNLEIKFDTKKIGVRKYIEELKNLQKHYKLTGDQARKVQREIFQANEVLKKQAAETKKTIDKINKGINDANTAYLTKVKSINEKLKNDIKNVQDEFKKQLANLAHSIYNQVGLFSEVKSEKKDGNTLLENLKDQNKQFKQWESDLAKLQKSGVSKEFVEELRAMGVSSADEINAIANMPKSMLNDYVKAWKEKHELANKEANIQMEQAKKDMEKQIKDLNAGAKKELEKAKSEWVTKIKGFTDDIKKLKDFGYSGKILGKNTVSGLITGLRSMKGPLEKEAKALAKTIEKTVKDTLKIKSPSRLMRDEVGKFIPLGLVEGIKSMKSKVVGAAEQMANAAIPNIPNVNIPARNVGISNTNLIDTTKGGGITQHITINSPTPLTPSEVARKNLQASRQLALEWGL